MNIRFTIKGTEAMARRLQDVGSREHRRAQSAMSEGGDLFLDYSKTLVPYDTGALHNSTANVETRNSRLAIERTIGYGAAGAGVNPKSGVHPGEYAVEQHEFPYDHKNGRTWKYLEFALYRRAEAFMDMLRRRLRI